MPNKARKKLIFITNIFPYGKGEAFIESEFPYLEAYFDEIQIITTHPKTANNRINSPKTSVKTFIYQFKFVDLLRLISLLFTADLWKELKDIKKTYRSPLSKTVINTLFKSFLYGQKMADFIAQENPSAPNTKTIIYSYWCNDTAIAACMAKKKISNSVAISKTHGWDLFFERAEANYLPHRRFLINNLNKIIFISQEGHDYFKNKFPYCPENKLHISKLGVNKAVNLNPEYNDTFRIVSCSNIIPLKQIDKIIEALSLLDSQVEWIHFGAGTYKYESKSKQLCKQKLDSKENIRYQLMGFVNNKDILNYYSENHISLIINSSKTEGLPVSIMEAMAAGIPVVAPAVNGIPEIVDDTNGLLLSADFEAKELAEAIVKFVNMNEDAMETYRRNAYLTWKEGYDAEKNFNEFVVFLDLL